MSGSTNVGWTPILKLTKHTTMFNTYVLLFSVTCFSFFTTFGISITSFHLLLLLQSPLPPFLGKVFSLNWTRKLKTQGDLLPWKSSSLSQVFVWIKCTYSKQLACLWRGWNFIVYANYEVYLHILWLLAKAQDSRARDTGLFITYSHRAIYFS